MSDNMPGLFNTVAKPGGSQCNLACDYCFYLHKPQTQQHHRTMSADVLEAYIRRVIEETPSGEVSFCWQGGEPTLCGLPFFEQVVALQARHAAGKTIHNSLQTNGVLLDDKWAEFLARHRFLVGLSVDGPAAIHDRYRRTLAGGPSFQRILRAVQALKKYEVEFNAMIVVNRGSMASGREIYRYLTTELGIAHLQFIPAVELLNTVEPPSASSAPEVSPWSVTSMGWGRFICDVFDEWVRHDVGQAFVQLFDNLLAVWMGDNATLCTMQPSCGQSLLVEKNGDVYSCDHFVWPQYRLGNVLNASLADMANSPFQQQFGAAKAQVSSRCQHCAWRFACHGGCPKHRILLEEGEVQNYLCSGYQHIFRHVTPYMNVMRQLLLNQQAPAGIMRAVEQVAHEVSQLQEKRS